jgi:hypothetical protein
MMSRAILRLAAMPSSRNRANSFDSKELNRSPNLSVDHTATRVYHKNPFPCVAGGVGIPSREVGPVNCFEFYYSNQLNVYPSLRPVRSAQHPGLERRRGNLCIFLERSFAVSSLSTSLVVLPIMAVGATRRSSLSQQR